MHPCFLSIFEKGKLVFNGHAWLTGTTGLSYRGGLMSFALCLRTQTIFVFYFSVDWIFPDTAKPSNFIFFFVYMFLYDKWKKVEFKFFFIFFFLKLDFFFYVCPFRGCKHVIACIIHHNTSVLQCIVIILISYYTLQGHNWRRGVPVAQNPAPSMTLAHL